GDEDGGGFGQVRVVVQRQLRRRCRDHHVPQQVEGTGVGNHRVCGEFAGDKVQLVLQVVAIGVDLQQAGARERARVAQRVADADFRYLQDGAQYPGDITRIQVS